MMLWKSWHLIKQGAESGSRSDSNQVGFGVKMSHVKREQWRSLIEFDD
jgi:hypothetical protein